MRRLDLRSTFRGWANSHEVPWINRDVLLWEVQAFTAKRLYPGAQGQPRFAASPWVHDGPARNGRAQDNDTHRRSTSPQQPAVCLSPRVTPLISVSEHAGVADDLRLDRSAMCGTKTQGAPPTTAAQWCPASTLGSGYNRFAVKTSTVPVQWVTCGTEMNNITR